MYWAMPYLRDRSKGPPAKGVEGRYSCTDHRAPPISMMGKLPSAALPRPPRNLSRPCHHAVLLLFCRPSRVDGSLQGSAWALPTARRLPQAYAPHPHHVHCPFSCATGVFVPLKLGSPDAASLGWPPLRRRTALLEPALPARPLPKRKGPAPPPPTPSPISCLPPPRLSLNVLAPPCPRPTMRVWRRRGCGCCCARRWWA